MQTVTVSRGRTVAAGEPIGQVGKESNVSGCHLHFEVHLENGSIYGPDNVDPVRLARRERITPGRAVTAAIAAAGALGELRIVVNCACTDDAIKTVGRGNQPYPYDKFQRIIEINLWGTFSVIRLAAAHRADLDLRGQERGVIVNTASVAAFDGQIGQIGQIGHAACLEGWRGGHDASGGP